MPSGNPLVAHYVGQRNRHTLVAREAYSRLVTCLHEAGHWVAFASHNVYVVTAEVDRRPGYAFVGRVVPTELINCVKRDQERRVDYVTTMAGPLAQYLFDPVRRGSKDCAGDLQDGREILASLPPETRGTRFDEYCRVADEVIRANWRAVEAFAYELWRKGGYRWGAAARIEAKYGLGWGASHLSDRQRMLARRRLSSFHPTPTHLRLAISTC